MLHDPLFVCAAAAVLAGLAFWLGYHLAGRRYGQMIHELQSPALDDVRWCYRHLLFRDPEHPRMVTHWVEQGLTFDELATQFISSEEFLAFPPDLQRRARDSLAQRRASAPAPR